MSNNKKWWHRPRPTGFLDYGQGAQKKTQYFETYIRHKIAPTESFKPPQEVKRSNQPVSDKTTQKLDYISHPLTMRPPPPKVVYEPPGTAMDGVTMYKQDYPGHNTGPAQITRRKEQTKIPGSRFEANPTYTSDYKKWAIPQRIKYGPVREFKVPDEKMDSISTFQRDFIHRPTARREMMKPPDVAQQSDQPIQSHTTNNTSFIEHPLEKRQQRERVKYQAPSVPMTTDTTFKVDFTGKTAPPTESMRPPRLAVASKDPLQSSSEFRDRFVAWPVTRPHRHEPDKYVVPEGAIDLQTTQRIDFKETGGRPASPKRPAAKRPEARPFEGTTNYSQDFKKWTVARTLAKGRPEAPKTEGAFEGMSTMRQHYTYHDGSLPAQSCKPDNTAYMSDQAIDDKTIYKTAYIPQSMARVERYPTPKWLEDQEHIWKQQGLMPGSTVVAAQAAA